MKFIDQLRCIYTNACSMGNKQELEAIVQQDSYDLIAITEAAWDDLCAWSAAVGGYKLFRRDRKKDCGERPWSLGGQQVLHGTVVCPCGEENQ